LIFDNASHHIVIFQNKKDKEAKRTSLAGGGATHRERTMYWILGKFFSNTLSASRSITHKRVDAENIGFLHHSIDLDTECDEGDIEDGDGAGAGGEGDAGDAGDAGAGGEDDEDDNGSAAANKDDDAGEASEADSATTQGAKKSAAAAKKATAAAAKKATAAAAAPKESRRSQESLNTTELPRPPLPLSLAAVWTRLHAGFWALSMSGLGILPENA
jgi:hypothetical protein